LVKIPEACAALSCGKTKLRELIDSGQLRIVRLGRGVRVVASDIERWAEENAQAAAGAS
jgi:excisionase family DNA binding protein